MKRTSLTRRLLAGAAGLTIGVAGALAVASPAFAHEPKVAGEAFCDVLTGEWVVTWTVESISDKFDAVLTDVTIDPSADPELSVITVGARVPLGDDVLQEQQRIPGDSAPEQIDLEVVVDFVQPGTDDVAESQKSADGYVELGGECKQLVDVFVSCDLLLFVARNLGDEGDLVVGLTPNQDAITGHAPWFLELEPDEDGKVEIPADAELEGAETLAGGDTFPLTLPPSGAHAHGFEGADDLVITVAASLGDGPETQQEVSWEEALDRKSVV